MAAVPRVPTYPHPATTSDMSPGVSPSCVAGGRSEHGASRAQRSPEGGAAGREAARLGNIAKNAGELSRSAEKRRERHALRTLAADVASSDFLRSCGNKVCRPEGVGVRGGSGQVAGFAGIETCGSVWACPACSAKIGAVRSASLAALLAWASGEGHTVAMLTLTARHHKGDRLDDLWSGLGAAWRHLGRSWSSETEKAFEKRLAKNREAWDRYLDKKRAGERCRAPRKTPEELVRRVGILESIGALGYVRATEVTHGAAGWHVHYHCVLILERSEEDREDPEDYEAKLDSARGKIFEAWKTGLAKNGYTAVERVREKDGSTSHVGADLRVMKAGMVEDALSGYLTKATDAVAAAEAVKKDAESIAAEATLGQHKKGRKSSRTPFQVLGDVAQTGDADDADLWAEWVKVSRGRRQLVWSNGLAELAKIADEAEKTDEEIAAEEIGSDDLFRLPNETWAQIRWNDRRFELLEAVEKGGASAGTALLDRWGLEWVAGVEELRQGSSSNAVLRNMDMTYRSDTL